MKQILLLFRYSFVILLFLSGCKENEFNPINPERPEPTISLSIEGESVERYSGSELDLTVTFTAQAGIKHMSILRNGSEFDSYDFPEGKVNRNYALKEIFDDKVEVGDRVDYQFSLEDNEGNTQSISFFVHIVAPPPLEPSFTIEERVLNGETLKVVTGIINIDTTLSNEYAYILNGNVVVDPLISLTIEEGTLIYAEAMASLIVSNRAKIIAKGTARKPIVFTSLKEQSGNGTHGDWVGIHVNGLAPVSSINSALAAKIGSYGANELDDNSGIIEYVRVEYAGGSLGGSGGALNFNGVGSQTIVNHVNVHEADNHGIRLRGGAVNIKHVYINNPDGRAYRWEAGYVGFTQYLLAVYTSNPSSAVTALEGYDPESNPTISNITILSLGSKAFGNSRGIRLRDGTLGRIYNSIITQTVTGVRADDLSGEIASDALFFGHSRLWNNTSQDYQNDATAFGAGSFTNSGTPVELNGYVGTDTQGAFSPSAIHQWFDEAKYIGAVPQGSDWTKNWTK